MEYMSASEAAQKWGVSLRQVQRLLSDKRIPCSTKIGRFWMIPTDAEKPFDLRKLGSMPSDFKLPDFANFITNTPILMPYQSAASIFDNVSDKRLLFQYESELAYMRGDFERALQYFLIPKKMMQSGCESVRWQ